MYKYLTEKVSEYLLLFCYKNLASNPSTINMFIFYKDTVKIYKLFTKYNGILLVIYYKTYNASLNKRQLIQDFRQLRFHRPFSLLALTASQHKDVLQISKVEQL